MNDPIMMLEGTALHRVHQGGVAKVAGVYLDHGYPVPIYLTALLDRLTWSGLLSVAAGDPVWELRQLSLTEEGQTRYAMLCGHRQRTALPAPPPEFGTSTPTERRSSATPRGRHHG